MPVWIAGRETERNLTVGFRVRFDGTDAVSLRYSASSIARVWLNGEFLCYGPARGPHGLDRIDEISLTGRLRDGVNILAFEVAGYNVDSFYLLNEPAYLPAEIVDVMGSPLVSTRPNGAFEAFILSERIQKVPRFSYQRPFCEAYVLEHDFAEWRTGGCRKPVRLSNVAGSLWTDRIAPMPDYSVSRVFVPLRRGNLAKVEPKKMYERRSVTGEQDKRYSGTKQSRWFCDGWSLRRLKRPVAGRLKRIILPNGGGSQAGLTDAGIGFEMRL